MANNVRILGFVSSVRAEQLVVVLEAVAGPTIYTKRSGAISALLQAEDATPVHRRGRDALVTSLGVVQRRLELACQDGPFLAMDPACACLPEDNTQAVLAGVWPDLTAALARDGALHQWDVILRWTPQFVVALRRDEIARAAAGQGRTGMADAVAAAMGAERVLREAALVACLAPAILALAPGGAACGETEIMATVLVKPGGEGAIEAALRGLTQAAANGAAVDLRGPMPPLSFTAVRVAEAEPGDVARAWHLLGLSHDVDRQALHAAWRAMAALVHPDRRAGSGSDVIQIEAASNVSCVTQAYHLLRDLLCRETSSTLGDLLERAGRRLVVPTAQQSWMELP